MNDKERHDINLELAKFMGHHIMEDAGGILRYTEVLIPWNPVDNIAQATELIDKVKKECSFYSCRQMLFVDFVHVELCFEVDQFNWKTYESDKCETASLAICQAIIKYLEAIK